MDIEKIRVLPDGVANQIAAGEVVGRPASVVKELLENAVDAGSTSVTVNFKEGGRALIQVVDNGCGMNEPDARMAFERHATSKIASVEDLSRLHSFGFRGEALPSIASVAEVELRTRTASAEVGTRVTINGGAFVAQEPVQTPVGTQFLVKNLFFNVPARRRFLKEPTVEARHLTSEFQRVALCHPEIEFTLYNNDTLVYSLPPGNLRQRIAGICGKGLANNLLDVAVETSIVKIEGYVGHPSVAKKTNREQYLFVNGRYFRSPYFHKAVLQAYEKLIAPETQPPYFLYLTVAPERIDVNVHPQKTEVKFEDEQAIWQIFNAAVRESLGKLGVVPLMDFEIDSSIDIPVYREGTVYREPEIGVNPDFNPFRTDTVKEKVHKMPAGGGVSPRTAPLDGWQNLYEIDSRAGDAGLADRFDEMDSALQAFLEGEPEPVQQSFELGGTAGFCGQVKLSDRLYATTLGDALAVVDVGRARERVLFERYLRLLGNNATVSQQLLFPERIELSPADGRLMAEIREELSSLGFEFSANGPAGVTAENGPADNKGAGEGVTYEITGIPPELPAGMVQDALHEALARVRELGGVPKSEKVRDLAAILARRGASGAAKIDEAAVAPLLDELASCNEPAFTPSGRAVLIRITREELAKRF